MFSGKTLSSLVFAIPLIMEQVVLEKRILTRESLVYGPSLEKAAKSWGKIKNFVPSSSSSSSSNNISRISTDEEEKCSFFRDMDSYKLDMRYQHPSYPTHIPRSVCSDCSLLNFEQSIA